jgi:hypothetical protein
VEHVPVSCEMGSFHQDEHQNTMSLKLCLYMTPKNQQHLVTRQAFLPSKSLISPDAFVGHPKVKHDCDVMETKKRQRPIITCQIERVVLFQALYMGAEIAFFVVLSKLHAISHRISRFV